MRCAYSARTMARRDSDKGRRLAEQYSKLSEGELQQLAQDVRSLTEQAKAALRFEITRRGLDIVVDELGGVEAGPLAPVILRTFLYLPEALLAKRVLDSAGIECFLVDEHTIRMNWFWTLALRGVKIWVRPEDADAGELLKPDYVESFHVEGVGEYRQPRCPKCGSFDISYRELVKKGAYLSFLGFWLLGFVPPALTRPGWKCHACGHSWRPSSILSEPPP
jgi:hypothetical protein